MNIQTIKKRCVEKGYHNFGVKDSSSGPIAVLRAPYGMGAVGVLMPIDDESDEACADALINAYEKKYNPE